MKLNLDLKKIVILLILVIVLLGIFYIQYLLNPIKTTELESHVKVENKVGINLDTDKIYFGTVSAGGTGERSIHVESEYDACMNILVEGEMKDWLSTKQWHQNLPGREEKSIKFEVHIPKGTPQGNYTGKVIMNFYRKEAAWLLC